jgi:hypothetical protein
MEILEERGIQDVVPGHPGSFFGTVSLPIDQILEPGAPSPGIQDFVNLIDLGPFDHLRRGRRIRCGGFCGGRRNRFKE